MIDVCYLCSKVNMIFLDNSYGEYFPNKKVALRNINIINGKFLQWKPVFW